MNYLLTNPVELVAVWLTITLYDLVSRKASVCSWEGSWLGALNIFRRGLMEIEL